LFKKIAIPAAKKSAFIITPTEYAKQRVHIFIKIPLERIVAIHQGPKTLTISQKEIPKWLPTQNNVPYILHVGVLEKEKTSLHFTSI